MTISNEMKDKFYDDLDRFISAARHAEKLILHGDLMQEFTFIF